MRKLFLNSGNRSAGSARLIHRLNRTLREKVILCSMFLVALQWLLPTTGIAAAPAAPVQGNVVRFQLTPNPNFVNCLALYPGDSSRPPTADVSVFKDSNNDVMTLSLHNIKPGLTFEVFTVQRSSLRADGAPNPVFSNFGFAWYQSDIQIGQNGEGFVEIRTALLDEIFGFDPDANLGPTHTYHVGLWFDDAKDAASCGFDSTHPTPFNGENSAGPLAMISLPDRQTGVGPLFRPRTQ